MKKEKKETYDSIIDNHWKMSGLVVVHDFAKISDQKIIIKRTSSSR